MVRRSVLLKTEYEIADFVSMMERCPYPASLECGQRMVDAKSLLGVMGFGLGSVATLSIDCDDPDPVPGIEKYVVS